MYTEILSIIDDYSIGPWERLQKIKRLIATKYKDITKQGVKVTTSQVVGIWQNEYPPETKTEDISNQLREEVIQNLIKDVSNIQNLIKDVSNE